MAVAIMTAAFSLTAAAPPATATGEQFSSYPSYSAKFDLESGKFSLITSIVVYNISGKTLTDVTFRQVYPEGVTVSETYQRDAGTEATGEQASSDRKIEANAFSASLPKYRNRQYAVLFNELHLGRRLNQVSFPGVEISYTDPQGAAQIVQLEESSYDLFSLSNVVGGLKRYLKKQNNIIFEFDKAIPGRTEWEFAPKAASAQGRFPTGIIESFPTDRYNGTVRIRTGPPGDTIQARVFYRQIHKKEFPADESAVLARMKEYLRWCGEFKFDEDNLTITQGKWKKYKNTWSLEGRWIDTINDRLGEGAFRAKAFFGAREDVEYFILGLIHGRGLGPEGSVTPNPEKEAQLIGELDALIDTFKSSITPRSYDRR